MSSVNSLTRCCTSCSFCDNELTRLEGFERNPLLEELALEENGIAKIEVRLFVCLFVVGSAWFGSTLVWLVCVTAREFVFGMYSLPAVGCVRLRMYAD